MSKPLCLIVGISIVFANLFVSAAENDAEKNWHHFRGPSTNGVSSTATPPTKWSATENVSWKVAIPGKGSSSPIIWGEKVFLTTAVAAEEGPKPMTRQELYKKFDANGDGELKGEERTAAIAFARKQSKASVVENKFLVMCFDRKTGDKVWEQIAIEKTPSSGTHRDGNYAAASPVTDGSHLYVNFGSIGLFCYDLDGKLVWKRTDLGEVVTRANFGEGSSVALDGDVLVLPWDHEGQSRIEAINKKTGETLWKKDRDEPSAWATPKIVEVDGKKQVIHSGENYSRGYDLQTGDELWRASGLSTRPVASPVSKGSVGFFASARNGAVLNAFPLTKTGDISNESVWKIDRQTPDCPSLLLSENRLFYTSGNNGIVSCANADDGSLFFGPKRLGKLKGCYSSPVAAGGKVFVTGRNGVTAVLTDGEEFELLNENEIGEPVDATLALAGKQIFIRGRQHLFCIE